MVATIGSSCSLSLSTFARRSDCLTISDSTNGAAQIDIEQAHRVARRDIKEFAHPPSGSLIPLRQSAQTDHITCGNGSDGRFTGLNAVPCGIGADGKLRLSVRGELHGDGSRRQIAIHADRVGRHSRFGKAPENFLAEVVIPNAGDQRGLGAEGDARDSQN